MSTVVTSQPGRTQEFHPLTIALPQVVMPAGMPASLAYLAGLEEVRVHQDIELLKIFCSFEQNNSYTICNNQELKFMNAKEDTNCLVRQCCGPGRPFDMDVFDLQGMPLMRLHRPLRCKGSMFWCCFLQEMEIQSPPGILAGHVKEIWTCVVPKYKVYNNQDQCIFTIVGECCCKFNCSLCVDILFRVFEGDDEATQVAHIRKQAGGLKEMCAYVSDFTLFMPGQMDVVKKALLFGATFLIDFNYFERSSN